MMTSFFDAIGMPLADTCMSLRSKRRAVPRISSATGCGASNRSVSRRAVSERQGCARSRSSESVPSWRMTILSFCLVRAVYMSSRETFARAGRMRKVVPNSDPCDLWTVTAHASSSGASSESVGQYEYWNPACEENSTLSRSWDLGTFVAGVTRPIATPISPFAT